MRLENQHKNDTYDLQETLHFSENRLSNLELIVKGKTQMLAQLKKESSPMKRYGGGYTPKIGL